MTLADVHAKATSVYVEGLGWLSIVRGSIEEIGLGEQYLLQFDTDLGDRVTIPEAHVWGFRQPAR